MSKKSIYSSGVASKEFAKRTENYRKFASLFLLLLSLETELLSVC